MGAFSKRTFTKTRRKTRDLDQIKADLTSPKHLKQFRETKTAEDLPSLGQHYCVECAKWFESKNNLVGHQKSKPHKRRYVFLLLIQRSPRGSCHYPCKNCAAVQFIMSCHGRSG